MTAVVSCPLLCTNKQAPVRGFLGAVDRSDSEGWRLNIADLGGTGHGPDMVLSACALDRTEEATIVATRVEIASNDFIRV